MSKYYNQLLTDIIEEIRKEELELTNYLLEQRITDSPDNERNYTKTCKFHNKRIDKLYHKKTVIISKVA